MSLSFNKIKHYINELLNRDFFNVNEMSKIGGFGQYTVVVESNDHPPAHFHIKINDKTVTRLQIPDAIPTRTYDLVYMNNDTRLSSKVEKDLIDWFSKPDRVAPLYNNLESLKIEWSRLHD